jgi:hypothetical protein
MCRVGRHFLLITISAGLFAASFRSFGGDSETSDSTAIPVPSHAVPAVRRPIPAHPIDPADTDRDLSMQRQRTVDRLYGR